MENKAVAEWTRGYCSQCGKTLASHSVRDLEFCVHLRELDAKRQALEDKLRK